MNDRQLEFIASIAYENSKLKEENELLNGLICQYKGRSLGSIINISMKNALLLIKDKISKQYKTEQWYEDVMELIKEAKSEG